MAAGAILLPPGEPVALASDSRPARLATGSAELYLRTGTTQDFVARLGPGDPLLPALPDGAQFVLVVSAELTLEPLAAIAPDLVARWADLLGAEGNDPATINAALVDRLANERAARDRAQRERLAQRAQVQAGSAGGGLASALGQCAQALGLDAPDILPGSEFDALPVLARRGGMSARRVTLGAAWPLHDQGPLVLRRRADGAVLAALWRGAQYRVDGLGPDPEDYFTDAFVLAPRLPERLASFGRVLRLAMAGNRSEVGAILLAATAMALIGTLVPIATGVILSQAAPAGDAAMLVAIGVALLFAALVTYLLSALRAAATARLLGKSAMRFSSGLFDRVLRLPTGFFRDYSAGDINQRIEGFDHIRELVLGIALSAGLSAVLSVVYFGVLAWYDLGLALIATGLIAIYILIVLGTRALQLPLIRAAATVDGQLAEQVYETIGAVAKLRTAAAEDRALARWSHRYAEERDLEYSAGLITACSSALRDCWQLVTQLTLYGAVAWLARDNLSPGSFIAFLAAFGVFQGAVVGLSTQLVDLFSAQPQVERVRPLLEAQPESEASRRNPGKLRGAISLRDAVFRYTPGGPAILDGVTLDIPAGAHCAIVGASGSGKSTLLRLLLGFETPESGHVFYDGQDFAALDPQLVRAQIGVVLQSSSLFAGPIIENVRGPHDASLERCLEAIAEAGLAEDMAGFPMGIHTNITEGAAVLSGGQRQRILIARALVAQPQMLFFDEATSALDNRSQAVVAATLDALPATRVTIAHRLSTVAHADMICVLEKGRLVEQGTHDELIALGGAYAALARRQMKDH